MFYVGLDLHKRYSEYAVMDVTGNVLNQGRVQNIPDEMDAFSRSLPEPSSIAIESSSTWYWAHKLLSQRHTVVLSNPMKNKAIASAKVKSDKVDARMLADLLRADLIPEAYMPGKDVREVRDLVRRRRYMVRLRTMLKNKVHAEIATRWVKHDGDLFTEDGRAFLRSLSIAAVDDYLDTIEFLGRKMRELDERVRPMAESDRYARLLMTIPGVGHYSALLISSEMADIDRFPDPEHLCSYARLSPGVHQSGDTQYTFKGAGNSMLSWIMIQCTRVHVRRCDSAITRFYKQVSRRRGEKVAIVAAARKLMKAAYVMLKEEKAFRLDG